MRLEGRACVCGCSDEEDYSAGSSDHGGGRRCADRICSCQRFFVLWWSIGTLWFRITFELGAQERVGGVRRRAHLRVAFSPSRVVIIDAWLFQLEKVDDDRVRYSILRARPARSAGYRCDMVYR